MRALIVYSFHLPLQSDDPLTFAKSKTISANDRVKSSIQTNAILILSITFHFKTRGVDDNVVCCVLLPVVDVFAQQQLNTTPKLAQDLLVWTVATRVC